MHELPLFRIYFRCINGVSQIAGGAGGVLSLCMAVVVRL